MRFEWDPTLTCQAAPLACSGAGRAEQPGGSLQLSTSPSRLSMLWHHASQTLRSARRSWLAACEAVREEQDDLSRISGGAGEKTIAQEVARG
jgi:hypothetical protein